jgi:hypothetical protein
MGKKKNDFDASGSGTKKEARPNRVTLPVEVARLMHTNWMLCDGWRDVHLPGGGWRLSHLRVPIPPVPPRKLDRSAEIRCRRQYLPPDLHADPAFAVDSNT